MDTKAEILEVIEDLKSIPCPFWACDGWDKPFKDMVTCKKCSSIQTLMKLIG